MRGEYQTKQITPLPDHRWPRIRHRDIVQPQPGEEGEAEAGAGPLPDAGHCDPLRGFLKTQDVL